MQHYKEHIPPLAVLAIILVALNAGMNTRLAPQGIADAQAAPGDEWQPLAGEWVIEEGVYTQTLTDGYDHHLLAPETLEGPATLSVTLAHTAGQGGGLLFGWGEGGGHAARFDSAEPAVFWGAYDVEGNFTGQGSVGVTAPGTDPHTLTIVLRDEAYDVLLDGAPLATDIPLLHAAGRYGLTTSQSAVTFRDLSVTPGPAPADDPPAQAEPLADGWLMLGGDWRTEGEVFVQAMPEGYDHNAINTTPQPAGRAYTVTVTHTAGRGAGVLFNMVSTEAIAGSHMVRFDSTAPALMWGYFDAEGAFIGQGAADLLDPGTTPQTLSVTTTAATYSISLNGAQVVEGVPLNTTEGYFGLTASTAAARFEGLTITEAAAAAPPPVDAPTYTLETITGEWVTEGNVIRQQLADTTDFITGTGLYAERYQLDVTITLPAEGEAGAGVVFHMPERDSRQNAFMVRLAKGGEELIWGGFDNNGDFAGAGGIAVGLERATPHRLSVTVRAGAFDVAIDGETLVTDVATDAADGWIGLTSFSGPVTFENLQITLGE